MTYKYIQSITDASTLVDDLLVTETLGLDLETSGLDPITDSIYLLQLNVNNNIYILDWRKINEIEDIIALIKRIDKKVIGHNLKFDLAFLYTKTGYMITNVYDTMLVEVLLNRGVGELYYSLAELTEKYCGIKLDKDAREDFYKSDKQIDTFTEQQLIYSALDVMYLIDIKKKQDELIATSGQGKVSELENHLLPVVTSMEREGILLDEVPWRVLMQYAQEQVPLIENNIKDIIFNRLNLEKYANLLELSDAVAIPQKTKRDRAALQLISDTTFYSAYLSANLNLSSHKQLLTVLNLIGIDVKSTGEKVLKELPVKDAVIEEILKYREYDKKATSFGESFLKAIHPTSGRLHFNLNQLGAVTGRFSCDSPNMQQIVRGSDYRKCFKPRKEYKFVTVDFSQQELRIAGSVTQEPMFIQAYNEGKDLHTLTASLILKKSMSDVTSDERAIGKGFNFALIYGSTAWGLAYNFNMKVAEAEKLLKNFYDGYKVLGEFKTRIEDFSVANLYAFTLTGRRRYFKMPEIFEDYKEYRAMVNSIRREGFNTLVQGTGADVTKISLNNIYYNNPFGDRLKLVLVIHDEILAECHESIANEALEFIKEQMILAEQPYLDNIPAAVDGKVGDTWSH